MDKVQIDVIPVVENEKVLDEYLPT